MILLHLILLYVLKQFAFVIELSEVEAITTTETVFRLNNVSYYPIDFADNLTNPNVTGFLNETVICLEGDLNCYQP